MTKHELGQYFTTNEVLKKKVFELIRNNPKTILEPSMGRGDLVSYVMENENDVSFDLYEIDETIEMLEDIDVDKIIFADFMSCEINRKYDTIIGNPPYVKTPKGNLYLDFILKCFTLLEDHGELIFIVPSDFFKLTSAVSIIQEMLKNGCFTHIYHPHDDQMFSHATVDVIVFRYEKSVDLEKICLYNDEQKYVINSNGMITFSDENEETVSLGDYFTAFVGIVSGKESVFKNDELGNTKVLNAKDKVENYILIDKYPCGIEAIDEHLMMHKEDLMNRRIRSFSENNWFEWGALRNVIAMKDTDTYSIYIHNLTRKNEVAFIDKVQFFGGNLIMLKPKKEMSMQQLNAWTKYLNGHTFKQHFMFSNRFKIGHRQLVNAQISKAIIEERIYEQ